MKHFNKYKKYLNKYTVSLALMVSMLTFPFSQDFAYQCGSSDNNQTPVTTSIDLGCTGQGNPILDMTFAIIRFLSAGVGIVVVFSTILAGIQYTVSKDSPEATAKAKGRLVSNIIALIAFLLAYALLNFLVPGGFLHG